MSDSLQRLADLPWTALIPAMAGVAVGVLLWLAGGRLLRTAMVAVGLMIGGTLGWAAGSLMPVGLPPWTLAVLGAVLCALAAWMSYRLTLLAGLTVVLGAAGGTLGWGAAESGLRGSGGGGARVFRSAPSSGGLVIMEGQSTDPGPMEGLPAELVPFITKALGGGTDNPNHPPPPIDPMLEKFGITGESSAKRVGELTDAANRGMDHLRAMWEQTPESSRPTIIGGAIVGAVLGLIVGLIAPRTGAMVLTAATGAMLIYACGWWLLTNGGGVRLDWAPTTRLGWGMVWLITALGGAAFQWTTRRRAADKPA